MPPKKYYAVRRGRQTGVFLSWDEAKRLVHGFSGAQYKSFKQESEALAYLRAEGSIGVVSSTPTPVTTKYSIQRPSIEREKSPAAAPLRAGDVHVGRPSSGSVASRPLKRVVRPSETWILQFDGGSRGNGRAGSVCGAGALLFRAEDPGQRLADATCKLSKGTNNTAEYYGAQMALNLATNALNDAVAEPSEVTIRLQGDSQLVLRQLEGRYQVRKEHLRAPLEKLQKALRHLRDRGCIVTLEHIPRAKNSAADALANEAMDQPSPRKEYHAYYIGSERTLETPPKRQRSAATVGGGGHTSAVPRGAGRGGAFV